MSKHVAVVLSGCGVYDGSEIHEAVLTLTALARAGATAVCCAPDIPQADVVNHLLNDVMLGEKRRVLVESARIARGAIRALADVHAAHLDAAIFPGGYGVAKNLTNFAAKGAACDVNEDVARLLCELHAAHKPIGLMCIAPILAARVFGDPRYRIYPSAGQAAPEQADQPRLRVRVTVGYDPDTAKAIEAMGGEHVNCSADRIVVDEAHKVISTPAYMLAKSPAEVEIGVSKLVAEVLRLTGAH